MLKQILIIANYFKKNVFIFKTLYKNYFIKQFNQKIITKIIQKLKGNI